MSRSGASLEALIGLAKQKLKEKHKEKKEAEAAAKLKSAAAKRRSLDDVKDIFMDPTSEESKEDSPKGGSENIKEAKSKKKKVSSNLPKEDEKVEKEPEVKAEELPVNPMDAIMKEIASLQADVETFEKVKKVKKAKKPKKRKRKHSSSSSSSSSSSEDEDEDEEPSVELEEKVEEEIAVEVKGLGALVTGYDSDEFCDEDAGSFELSKPKAPKVAEPKLGPNIAPSLDDDFLFLKPTITANMIPRQVAGGPKKVKKVGLCDRLVQQGGQTENKSENGSAPQKSVYNPLTGKREKVEAKPTEVTADIEPKNAQLLSVSQSPIMSEKLKKESLLENSSKGEIKSTETTTPLKTSNSANEPQYKYNPLTGYRDLLVGTIHDNPFTVGASSLKVEKPAEKAEATYSVSHGFIKKGICKYFNMKMGCRHGENCYYKHEKYKNQAPFYKNVQGHEDSYQNYQQGYENENQNYHQGHETRTSVSNGPSGNKETDISPSDFYNQFIQKSLKQKKGAGIFFEKAKENLVPDQTNMIDERNDVVKQNGFKSETREFEHNDFDVTAKKREEAMQKAQIVRSNLQKNEIVGSIINDIFDSIFTCRSFGNSKSNSRSRSSSISLSNSSDEEEELNQNTGTRITGEKSTQQRNDRRGSAAAKVMKQTNREQHRERHQLKRKQRNEEHSRSRSRSQSRGRDKKKSRNDLGDKGEKKSRSRKYRSNSRDRIRHSRSRSPSRTRARVLPSSYLEQVRNGIPPEWNQEKDEEKYERKASSRSEDKDQRRKKSDRSSGRSEEKYREQEQTKSQREEIGRGTHVKRRKEEKSQEEEIERETRVKRIKKESEDKNILSGLEELLSIEKNKECPRVLNNSIGIVTSIINESYAIAAVTLPYSKVKENERKGPFRVLFDTCEFWIENRTASDLGISLEQVIGVGDYVKINAILIEKPNARNINYMATATKTSDSIINLLREKFAPEIATNDIKEVSKSKLDNFDVVVKFLSASSITDEEMRIEMKSEKDADSNLLSRAKEWKNFAILFAISSIKNPELERKALKLSEKSVKSRVSSERKKRSSRDSDEAKSRDSGKGKNGFRESEQSSSSDDEDYRKDRQRARDKRGRNESRRSSETSKRKKSSSRSRSRERKNKRSQERERRTKRSRSRSRDYRKRGKSKSPVSNKRRSRSGEKEPERKTSRRSREDEYERKASSRSQEKDHRRKRSDRSSERDSKRKRSSSRENKLNGRSAKEKDNKRKSSTESRKSENGREPCSRLPAKFSYWNQNLIKILDDGDYIDCIHCQETLATKPDHKFLPYYVEHYSSASHELKMSESSTSDQDCVNDYMAHSSELDYFIQLELDKGAAEVIYDKGDLRLFTCKYCRKVGTTAWHFYKLKNSKLHSEEALRS